MKQNKILYGDFVVSIGNIENIVNNSVGIVNDLSQNQITVYFVGRNKILTINESNAHHTSLILALLEKKLNTKAD